MLEFRFLVRRMFMILRFGLVLEELLHSIGFRLLPFHLLIEAASMDCPLVRRLQMELILV